MYLHFNLRHGPAGKQTSARPSARSTEPAWDGNSLHLSIHDLTCPTCLAPTQPSSSGRVVPDVGCPTCGRASTEWRQLTEIDRLLDEFCAFARLEAALS